MSVDYDQLKALVKEAMFTGGGINEPSAPEGDGGSQDQQIVCPSVECQRSH